MRLFEYLNERNKRKLKLLEQELIKQEERRNKRDEVREKIVDNAINTPTGMVPILCGNRGLFGNGFWGVSKDNEPFGWAPGTVRGIITIWTVLVFNIVVMYSFISGTMWIPVEWYLGIMGAIILSYFYSRYRMTNGFH